MARRKKQKNRKDGGSAAEQISTQDAAAPAGAGDDSASSNQATVETGKGQKTDPGLEKAPPAVKPGAPKPPNGHNPASENAAKKRGIRLSSCIAGMFLTFILGIYLGVMLPQITQEITGKKVGEKIEKTETQAAPAPEAGDTLSQAIRELERKVRNAPDSAEDWIALGNAYFDAAKPPQSIAAYEKALQLAPDNADVFTDLGIMYRESGQYQKALDCFRRAISINPAHQNAMYNEGVVLAMDLGEKEKAAAAWQRLLNLNTQAKAPDGTPLADMIKKLQ